MRFVSAELNCHLSKPAETNRVVKTNYTGGAGWFDLALRRAMPGASIDHSGELFRIVYASRAILPVLAKFEATVEEILVQAQPNNAKLGVTGLLLAHQGWFLQALEGPRRNVSQIFGSIGRDLRHAQLELMVGSPAHERLFGRWSMCGRAVTPSSEPILTTLDLARDFDPFKMDSDTALRLLTAIAKVAPTPSQSC